MGSSRSRRQKQARQQLARQDDKKPTRPQIDNTAAVVRSEQSVEIATEWSGPLPHPQDLAEYDAIVPGAAATIIEAFREQGRHRRRQENRMVMGNEIRGFVGQAMGFLLALAFLVAAFLLVRDGHEVSGTLLGTVDLVALVSVFVIGRRSPDE